MTVQKVSATEHFDEAFLLLEQLGEDELNDLNEEFDPENTLMPASQRTREEEKRRMFGKNDMMSQLTKVINKNLENIGKKLGGPDKFNKDAAKKAMDAMLSPEDEDLFEDITEEELIEFAALSNMHGMITQEQVHAVAAGDAPKVYGILTPKPVKGPGRQHLSLSDEDLDLDVPCLFEYLDADTYDIFYVRINNIPLEPYVLKGIFDHLKITKNLKHLSLVNAGINDAKMLELIAALKENTTMETLNLECNDITNLTLQPLVNLLLTHPTFRELKIANQKKSLGLRGEDAMATLVEKNTNMMKVGYVFEVPAPRVLADICQIRNQDRQRELRAEGKEFYDYANIVRVRDAHPQPWIRKIDPRDNKLRVKISDQKVRMKSIPNIAKMRADARKAAKTGLYDQ